MRVSARARPRPPIERAGYEQTVAALCSALGEGDFAAAWAEGGALSLDEVVNEALRDSA